MAYGLHSIAHKNYSANGTGRDWFFLGDFEYRNGRITPTGNAAGKRPQRPPGQKRGAPSEIAFHKSALASSGRAKTVERWRQVQAENTAGCSPQQQLACLSSKGQKPVDEDRFAATSWQLGRLPDWKGTRYELSNGTELESAGVNRSSSASVLEMSPGDHTRGIRGARAHFTAESWKLGNAPGWEASKFELSHGMELSGAGTIRDAPTKSGAELSPGNHTLGICSRAPHFKADSHNLGQLPGWRHPEVGSPAKHHFYSAPCFPEAGCHAPGVQAGAGSGGGPARAPSARPGTTEPGGSSSAGDHTQGIRSSRAHFTSTYGDIGQIPGWNGKRYDFGPLANARFRLTEWGRDKA